MAHETPRIGYFRTAIGTKVAFAETEESTRSSVVCGSDLDRHVARLRESIDAGFDEVYLANMGPYYADMIRFYGERVLPATRGPDKDTGRSDLLGRANRAGGASRVSDGVDGGQAGRLVTWAGRTARAPGRVTRPR